MDDEDTSFYNEVRISESLENDEITPEEEGFMKGYLSEDDEGEIEDESRREEEAV